MEDLTSFFVDAAHPLNFSVLSPNQFVGRWRCGFEFDEIFLCKFLLASCVVVTFLVALILLAHLQCFIVMAGSGHCLTRRVLV